MAWNLSEGSGDIYRGIVIVGLYIALGFIEYQMLAESWAVYCSEIDRRS